MAWPDPYCHKNHQPGAVYQQWEHTPDCVRHAPRRVRKDRRITEVRKGDEEGLVSRAREAGAL